MTVEQFTPKAPKQTTTLETPKKVLAEQSENSLKTESSGNRIGFISLGCPEV